MGKVRAVQKISPGFPLERGRELADRLLSDTELCWDGLTIDCHRLEPDLLISGFIRAFLERVVEKRPDLLDSVKSIRWETDYDWQRENVEDWVSAF